MPKSYYLPTDDSGKIEVLEMLAAKLPAYKDVLYISTEEIEAVQADAIAMRYILSVFNQMQNNAKQWTAYKNLIRDGGASKAALPVFPSLPEPVPPTVPPGIIPRLTSLVTRIKAARNYTDVLGQDLGIVGTVKVVDPATWKPTLDTRIEAGRPYILWSKGKADSLEIWVDRGNDKGFVFLDISTDYRFADNAPMPNTVALWKYKAIYRLRDQQVGQWSNVHAVPVGG